MARRHGRRGRRGRRGEKARPPWREGTAAVARRHGRRGRWKPSPVLDIAPGDRRRRRRQSACGISPRAIAHPRSASSTAGCDRAAGAASRGRAWQPRGVASDSGDGQAPAPLHRPGRSPGPDPAPQPRCIAGGDPSTREPRRHPHRQRPLGVRGGHDEPPARPDRGGRDDEGPHRRDARATGAGGPEPRPGGLRRGPRGRLGRDQANRRRDDGDGILVAVALLGWRLWQARSTHEPEGTPLEVAPA